jgi:hypothetical protein
MTEHDPTMERARNRAKQLREYYGHLVTYVLVCSLLVVIDLADGSAGTEFIGLNWAYWPIFGWGIAIVIHTISVALPFAGWEERKAQELYEKERQREMIHR